MNKLIEQTAAVVNTEHRYFVVVRLSCFGSGDLILTVYYGCIYPCFHMVECWICKNNTTGQVTEEGCQDYI